jgi:hypothetical protein
VSGKESGYSISASPKFAQDLQFLRSRAMADPAAHGHLYRETLREIEKLRAGTSDGHHPLEYETGKGDLRDCVTAYVQSDPQKKADHRLASSGGNQAQRRAELDTQRAVAQAWAGQQPLSTSKPLDAAHFGRRGQTRSAGPSHQAPQQGL